jgi:hypothetical protein
MHESRRTKPISTLSELAPTATLSKGGDLRALELSFGVSFQVDYPLCDGWSDPGCGYANHMVSLPAGQIIRLPCVDRVIDSTGSHSRGSTSVRLPVDGELPFISPVALIGAIYDA